MTLASAQIDKRSIEFLVDFILPELTPYEFAVYALLLRLETSGNVRIGKRTIAALLGKGTRAKVANFNHITDVLNSLQAKSFIKIGETNREGTDYSLVNPFDIPAIADRLALTIENPTAPQDYFNDPKKRLEIFERDKWKCHYCGKSLTSENATLDHVHAQSKGGSHSAENLAACCLECNAIKNGRTIEEAAVDLLKRIGSNAKKQS